MPDREHDLKRLLESDGRTLLRQLPTILVIFFAGLTLVGMIPAASPSTVNTLLLAYAGAAMPLMLFFVLANQSLGMVLNSELVAIEAIRTLVGSIGLVSAVPLTTWLATVMVIDQIPGEHGHLMDPV